MEKKPSHWINKEFVIIYLRSIKKTKYRYFFFW